jgi:hypothetical protein
MRRVGVLVCLLLAGGVVAAGATAAPANTVVVHLSPAATSIDHAPFCELPSSTLTAAPTAGGTLVTFTLVPPGCD